MVAVVETFRKRAVMGDLKTIVIQTSAAAATGHTIDLNSDATDGKGVEMTQILNTLVQDDAGADKTSTWDPATGIITLGTITTGIHNVMITGY
ncbi:hypothetical protein KAU11_09905 [Candidatus Babeliales bacterium]|nr:hypothetical protein [Candidatus Babeliales bacterium]